MSCQLSKNMSKVNMAIPICVYMYRNYISYTLTLHYDKIQNNDMEYAPNYLLNTPSNAFLHLRF